MSYSYKLLSSKCSLLSAHHNRFSKHAFASKQYLKFDMSSLDLTLAKDYMTFVALTANGQGTHGEQAVEAMLSKNNQQNIVQWCATQSL